MTTTRTLMATAVLIPLLAGCDPTANGPAGPTPGSAGRTAGPIEVNQISAAGLDAVVAEQKGKVVFIDGWFLGCAPCKKKFPHVVELHEKYKPDGLVVMSFSVMADDWHDKDKVLEFLKSTNADFAHYIASTPEDSHKVMEKYGFEFTPATVLIDRTGKQLELSEEPSDEEVEAAIRKALAAK